MKPEQKDNPMNITIRRQYHIGSCCGDERFIWVTEEVTPQELKRLINRCETIRVINNTYSENKTGKI
jgi:hypothetical protein